MAHYESAYDDDDDDEGISVLRLDYIHKNIIRKIYYRWLRGGIQPPLT